MLSSCCGGRRKRPDEARDALLPYASDDTALQRDLRRKMHTYHMARALRQGFLPSTEQVVAHLRTLMAAEALSAPAPDLSDTGRRLVRSLRRWLLEVTELLLRKNDGDLIQDFAWFLVRARVEADINSIGSRGAGKGIGADARMAYEGVRTVGGLLLANSDFRLFLGDMGTIGRQVFADTAMALRDTAEQAAKEAEPKPEDVQALAGPGADKGQAPTEEGLREELDDVAATVSKGLVQTGEAAVQSAKDNLAGDQKATVLNRLQEAVAKLRKRPDYNESVSTLGYLVKRYLATYTRPVEEAIGAAGSDIHTNDELDRAAQNLWKLATSFGSADEWAELEARLRQLMRHSEAHPEFDGVMADVGTAVQRMLQDPEFWASADRELEDLQAKAEHLTSQSSVAHDVDALLAQLRRTFHAVLRDSDVARFMATTWELAGLLSPEGSAFSAELLDDALHVFIPLVIRAVQYVPIPRVEVSTPDIDLLLENLIIEPGETVNDSSFLPYRLRIRTQHDVEIRKARHRTAATTCTVVTVDLQGLSLRAQDVGYWVRGRAGLLRFVDEGIASIALDREGLDVSLEIEVGNGADAAALSLRDVHVNVHRLDYTLRRSKFSAVAWLFKPLLRPLLRRAVQAQAEQGLRDLFAGASREIRFARERFRAARVAGPKDLLSFLKAVAARLVPADDPDVRAEVGVRPAVFRGVYAPGSLVRVWEEEALEAEERVEQFAADGWRNGIFDVLAL